MNGWGDLIVAGSGEAETPQPGMFEARARATVRYADPAAWITATAVAIAISSTRDLLAEFCHDVGMVVVSDEGPTGTMAEVETGGLTGFSSPLRYAASSPGTLAGVSCIAFGFRGPTLNLTMAPEDGVPVAITMCAGWLTRKAARFMVLATFRGGSATPPSGRAMLLAPPGLVASGSPLTVSMTDWLVDSRSMDRVKS